MTPGQSALRHSALLSRWTHTPSAPAGGSPEPGHIHHRPEPAAPPGVTAWLRATQPQSPWRCLPLSETPSRGRGGEEGPALLPAGLFPGKRRKQLNSQPQPVTAQGRRKSLRLSPLPRALLGLQGMGSGTIPLQPAPPELALFWHLSGTDSCTGLEEPCAGRGVPPAVGREGGTGSHVGREGAA